jgi:hypothetical protein
MARQSRSFWTTPNGWGVIALIGAASYFLLTEHRENVFEYLPYLILLLCPVMHLFMHHGHGHGHHHNNDVQHREYGPRDVTNQGDTIPQENLRYLFDRFYRVDKSRQHLGSIGAGLGLSITQSIVHAYDGEISVQSQNEHTEFQMTFHSAVSFDQNDFAHKLL